MSIFSKILQSLRNSVLDPEITPDVLRERYEGMNDTELGNIDEAELTPEARGVLRSVKAGRNRK